MTLYPSTATVETRKFLQRNGFPGRVAGSRRLRGFDRMTIRTVVYVDAEQCENVMSAAREQLSGVYDVQRVGDPGSTVEQYGVVAIWRSVRV